MQIFANGKRHFHSFINFYVIRLKQQEVKIWSQWHFKLATFAFAASKHGEQLLNEFFIYSEGIMQSLRYLKG